jgi:hypothetical protein
MSIPPTDADGLAKFLAGDVDTFFAHPGGLPVSAAPATNDAGISTSPPPNSNDNPPPQRHLARAGIAEPRFRLEAPAAGDQIRPPGGTSHAMLAGPALSLAAALVGLGLVGAAAVKIVAPKSPPVIAAASSSPVAAESPGSARTADPVSGTETTDKALAAPSPLTAARVDEARARAAMNRWYAERQQAIDRAPLAAWWSARSAALHKTPPPRVSQSHSPALRRPATAAGSEFSDLPRTIAPPSVPGFSCSPSLAAACTSSR